MNKTSKLSPLQRLWLLIKPDQAEVKNIYVYSIFNGLVSLSLPIGIQSIINLIQGGQVSTSWIVLVLFVIIGIFISGLLQISQLRITENLQQKIFVRAAFEFVYRVPRIKLEALFRQYAPELMNRFFDVMTIQKGIAKLLIDFSAASIQVVLGLLLLSLYHPFFIVFSLILVVLLYFIFKFTGQIGLQTSLMESKYKYKVAHWLQEVARVNISFKFAGNTDLGMVKNEANVSSYIKARDKHFSVLVKQYYMMIIFKVVVAAGLLFIGGILVIEQQMNIGQFVAAEIIILLVIGSVEKLILNLEVLYDVLTGLEKIGLVTDLEIEEESGLDLETTSKGLKVELNKISFSYPEQEKLILDEFNLIIEPSERLLVAGGNESGKATLIKLIAGLYRPKSGYIGYNDFHQGNLNPINLRNNIGECLSEDLLFQGTLLENITMGREKATMENVKWAVKNLRLEKIIKDLPDGYNTQIFPEGMQFSTSVTNKILLARSIVTRPKLLIIKDVFQSFGYEEKIVIRDFITDIENNWTLLVISTDKDLADRFDNIAILSEGKLAQIGTVSELKHLLK